MKLRDMVGRWVRLEHRCVTKGGDVWDEGEVLRVTGTWRGTFTLAPLDPDPQCDGRTSISHIHRGYVRLLTPAEVREQITQIAKHRPTSHLAVLARETTLAIADSILESSFDHDSCDYGHCERCQAESVAQSLTSGDWLNPEDNTP